MSAYRALRLGFLAGLLLLVGAGRLAAADSYPFKIRLNSSLFGEKVFTGEIAPEGGSFEMFVTSGSTRIHMTGSIAGDHVHVYGELVIPGSATWQRYRPFSADGTFGSDGTAEESIVAYPFQGTPARGTITIKRPVTAIAAAPAAPAAQGAAPQSNQSAPSTPAVTQSRPATTTQTAVVPPPAPEEPALTNSQRVTVQHQLSVLGFYKSNVDGDFGPGTRKAIKSFQRANGLAATGYVTDTTLALLADKSGVRETQLAEQQAAEQQAAQQAAAQQAQQQAAQQQAAQQAAQQNADTDFTGQHQSASVLTHRTPTEQTQPATQQTTAAATPETTTAPPAQPTTSATTATAETQQSTAPAQPPPPDFSAALASLQPIDESFVAVKPAKVRTQPKVTADLVETLNVGDRIDVLGRLTREDWYLVARAGKPIGYVVMSQLGTQSTVASTSAPPAEVPAAPQPTQTQTQAQPPAPAAPAISPELAALDYGHYYAVVIGNNNYKKLPKLNTAVEDAKAVAATLEQDYGFTVSLLTDASEEQVVGALDALRRKLTPQDNLLIYYAGHGWYDDGAERGYWLPVDAVADNQSHWISNADITDSLKAMQAKHVLVVADSCYSGSLTRGLAIGSGSSSYFEDIVKRRARTVLTSGGLEPVLDAGGGGHSVFARAFLDALQANNGVIDGEGIYHEVYDQVRLNAEQEPGYGNIRLAGHDGGDFLFVRKR
jgi:peptidoglycan hydrolase-like protein with peptidoglycan-binding domain